MKFMLKVGREVAAVDGVELVDVDKDGRILASYGWVSAEAVAEKFNVKAIEEFVAAKSQAGMAELTQLAQDMGHQGGTRKGDRKCGQV